MNNKKSKSNKYMKSKYMKAWEVLENNETKKAKRLFRTLMLSNYYKAWYDVGGFYYYGMYGYTKNKNKAIKYYKKAFILSQGKDREILKDYLYAKKEIDGLLLAFMSVVCDFKILTLLVNKKWLCRWK